MIQLQTVTGPILVNPAHIVSVRPGPDDDKCTLYLSSLSVNVNHSLPEIRKALFEYARSTFCAWRSDDEDD